MSEEHSRGRLNWPSQWHAWLRIAMTQMHLLTSQSSVYMWTVMLNEAKTSRPRPELLGQGQFLEVEAEAKINYEKSTK